MVYDFFVEVAIWWKFQWKHDNVHSIPLSPLSVEVCLPSSSGVRYISLSSIHSHHSSSGSTLGAGLGELSPPWLWVNDLYKSFRNRKVLKQKIWKWRRLYAVNQARESAANCNLGGLVAKIPWQAQANGGCPAWIVKQKLLKCDLTPHPRPPTKNNVPRTTPASLHYTIACLKLCFVLPDFSLFGRRNTVIPFLSSTLRCPNIVLISSNEMQIIFLELVDVS